MIQPLHSVPRYRFTVERMTDQVSPGLAWVPDACTLPTTEQPLRLAEFDALFTDAVRDAERLSTQRQRIALAAGPDLEGTVLDLTAREAGCCSFFTFTITSHTPGQVQLDIEVPIDHIDVLDALADRAAAVRGRS